MQLANQPDKINFKVMRKINAYTVVMKSSNDRCFGKEDILKDLVGQVNIADKMKFT